MLHFDHFFVTYQILQSSDGLCNLENFLSCATLTHMCILPPALLHSTVGTCTLHRSCTNSHAPSLKCLLRIRTTSINSYMGLSDLELPLITSEIHTSWFGLDYCVASAHLSPQFIHLSSHRLHPLKKYTSLSIACIAHLLVISNQRKIGIPSLAFFFLH